MYNTYNLISTSSVPELVEKMHYKLNRQCMNPTRKNYRKCSILKFTLIFSETKGPYKSNGAVARSKLE